MSTVYILIDMSGSMGNRIHNVMKGLKALTQTPGTVYKYIYFNHKSYPSATLEAYTPCGKTDIEQAFYTLKTIFTPGFKSVVVFISDGEDNNPSTIVARLQKLGGFKACTLFTVAMGRGLPTSMIVDALRPAWHNTSDLLPFVFTIEDNSSEEDVLATFAELAFNIFEVDHEQANVAFDCESSLSHLIRCVQAVMNQCKIRCMHERNQAKALEFIATTRSTVKDIETQYLRLKLKPLVSTRAPMDTLLQLIASTRSELNRFHENTLKNVLLSSFNDQQKQTLLSWGNVEGKYTGKALQYREGDFHKCLESLVGALEKYTPTAADDDVQDVLSQMTLREAFLDAKEQIAAIRRIDNILDLMKTLALIGRPLRVISCDGTQINPFLLVVADHATKIQKMNTYDFFTHYHGAYEEGNMLMLNTTSGAINGSMYGRWAASYLVNRNMAIYDWKAHAAITAAVVAYVLAKPKTQFLDEMAEEARVSFVLSYPQAQFVEIHSYIEQLKGDFRLALVNTFPTPHPEGLQCEHLTKFVMAIYTAIKQGHSFTKEMLRERMLALYAEKVGRENETKRFIWTPAVDAETALTMVATEALDEYTLQEGLHRFTEKVAEIWPASQCHMREVQLTKDERFYQFDADSIQHMFERLHNIAGEPVESDYWTITTEERTRAFDTERLSSFERNTIAVAKVLVPENAMRATHAKDIRSKAPAYFEALYAENLNRTHSGLPKQGTTPVEGVVFNPDTKLPYNACAFEGCACFMVPMPLKLSNGKPQISERLWAHLAPINPVPGFHRFTVSNPTMPVEEIVATIEHGNHVLDAGERTEAKRSQVTRAVKANGGRTWLVADVIETLYPKME